MVQGNCGCPFSAQQPPWMVSWQDEINDVAFGLTLPGLAKQGKRRELDRALHP